MDENPFKKWKVKKGLPASQFLNEDELQALMELYVSRELEYKYNKRLELFLFLCFSSLHIGDFK